LRHTYLVVLGVLIVGGAAYVSARRHPDTYRASVVVAYEGRTLFYRAIDAGDIAYQASTVQSYVAAPISEDMVATAHGAVPERSVAQILAEVHLSDMSNQPGILVTADDSDAQVATGLANGIAIGLVNHYTQTALQSIAVDPTAQQLQASLNTAMADVARTQADLAAAKQALLPTASLTDLLAQEQAELDQVASALARRSQSILDTQPVFVIASLAQNAERISYGMLLTTSLGTLAGLLAGLTLALLIEYLDDTVRGPADIKRWASLDTLAIISDAPRPASRGDSPALTPPFHARVAQPLRRMVIGLVFATLRHPRQTLLVVPVDNSSIRRRSATPPEDWTAINLAVTYALAGQQTVLVDANWRHPTIEKRFGLPIQELGVFTSLADLDATSRSVAVPVLPTTIPTLHILPLGLLPPRIDDLLQVDLLDVLFERLRRDYARIVVLAPDDLASAAGKGLVDQIDCGVPVARSGETSGLALRKLATLLRGANVHVPGAILLATSRVPEGVAAEAPPLGVSAGQPRRFTSNPPDAEAGGGNEAPGRRAPDASRGVHELDQRDT
jgi:capsular polysaccharide biosynthesis protein